MKFRTITANYVNYKDLNEAVDTFLKSNKVGPTKKYNCIESESLEYDSNYGLVVAPSLPSQGKIKHIHRDIRDELDTILNWMCALEEIPAGDYQIEVY